jgi:hypothetical protein
MYSKGIMWLDDCRIPFVDEKDPSAERYKSYRNVDNLYGGYGDTHYNYKEQQGRFTPNLLVCDDMLNDGKVVQYNKTRVDNGSYLGGHREEFVGTDNNPIKNKIKGQFFSDKGTNSRYYDLDLWFDKMLEKL